MSRWLPSTRGHLVTAASAAGAAIALTASSTAFAQKTAHVVVREPDLQLQQDLDSSLVSDDWQTDALLWPLRIGPCPEW